MASPTAPRRRSASLFRRARRSKPPSAARIVLLYDAPMDAPTANEMPSLKRDIVASYIFLCLWGWVAAGAAWGGAACWPDDGTWLCAAVGSLLALIVSPVWMACALAAGLLAAAVAETAQDVTALLRRACAAAGRRHAAPSRGVRPGASPRLPPIPRGTRGPPGPPRRGARPDRAASRRPPRSA